MFFGVPCYKPKRKGGGGKKTTKKKKKKKKKQVTNKNRYGLHSLLDGILPIACNINSYSAQRPSTYFLGTSS